MASKVTFFYHDNLGGFSESWIDNSQVPLGFDDNLIAGYLNARMDVSGEQTVWDYVRISDLDKANARKVKVVLPGDVQMRRGNVPEHGQYQQNRAGAVLASDFSGTRFLVRKQSADLSQARFFMAGFPDNQCDLGGKYVPSGLFPGKFLAFDTVIKNNNWGWISYTTPLIGYKAALLSAVTGIDQICTLTAVPIGANPDLFAAPIKPGDHVVVRIANQNSPKNANGTFTVIVTGPNTARTVKPLSITNFVVGNGTIAVKKTANFQKSNQLLIERVVKRGPGRPFGLYRGRQAVKPRG